MDGPFVRFSRDRQGYEHFFIMHFVAGRRGKVRQRILYWFRTPPNVKMGREPFDDSVRRALEAQNPNLRFDWAKIRNTTIPPAQPEYWRERRMAERAARQAEDDPKPEPEAVQLEVEPGPAPLETEPEAGQDAAGRPPVSASSAEESRRSRRRRRRRGGGSYTGPSVHGGTDSAGQTAAAPPSSMESHGPSAMPATPEATLSPGTPGTAGSAGSAGSPALPDSADSISPFGK